MRIALRRGRDDLCGGIVTFSILHTMKARILNFALILFLLFSISACDRTAIFTEEEIRIIKQDPAQIMRIYTIDNPNDTSTLRAQSLSLSDEEISSDYYKFLSRRMIQTLSDSNVDGVGLAAPQIGINRRIIVVQRFDKPNSPFEVFPNIYIKEYSKDTTFGTEGCLSVPDKSGKAVRSKWVVVSYTDPLTMLSKEDTIKEFTSIIFQHEIDHLDGIMYMDSIRAAN